MRLVVTLISFWLLMLAVPAAVQAHSLETDRNIGAVIHIDPNDNPVVGQPANFYFDFKDLQHKFDATQCSCQLKVMLDGATVATLPLTSASNPLTATATYNFTKKGIYDVEVSGSPNSTTDFQSFHLTYDVQVEGATGGAIDGFLADNWWRYVVVGGVALSAGLIIFDQYRRHKRHI